MRDEQKLTEFVDRLRQSAGSNLESVILYGSAASDSFVPEHSDLNVLCILRDTSYAALSAIAPVVQWWTGKLRPAPLLLTQSELERSADVFSIEFTDMQRTHRILFGDDPLSALKVPMHFHRAQVEYELREKAILLRQHLLLANNDKKRLWEILLNSIPAFSTLFRHALIAVGEAAPLSKREAVERLAARVGFDATVFTELFDIRHRQRDRKHLAVTDVAARYLSAVEQVTAAVDAMLDASGPQVRS